jgi:hypothetical protein
MILETFTIFREPVTGREGLLTCLGSRLTCLGAGDHVLKYSVTLFSVLLSVPRKTFTISREHVNMSRGPVNMYWETFNTSWRL